ncbi:quaternary amine ABC transporter ATP-binding protein [Chitinimonas koreensis]|uniref:quaternary amine ABC transporter ATP-binding protein n=1 Tax=Chitinimonas koreensis TaxID=356302 RepID=UPI0003FD5EF3|nr:betaine/proline/choline family ABC transporter ATP-binding protein [Chitinimonas koreensis]QNM96049.1 betaine/proline/choline family ABC transporter ATP-binding protein [Chitinimonas koreensis]
MSRIRLIEVSKVYGPAPREALARLAAGEDKAAVLAATGSTAGLDRVSLEIGAGERFVVMGLSGSGKSTLVRHLNRLVDPSAGRIEVDGEDILGYGAAALRDYRRHKVSMVFQGFGLLPHRDVLGNVAYGLEVRGEPRRRAQARAAEWLERVGLAGYAAALPDALSGGMRQRVGLARALAMDTPILLMDEPFSALDPLIRAEMQAQLLELQAALGKTVVFITHDLDEALRLGQRIAILRDGRVVQVDTPERILAAPADDYVRRFVERRAAAG